ncbi:MAG TPA: glycosyltransferase 87 family protein [Anaerolineales bacterium]
MAFRDIRKQRRWLSAEEARVIVIGLFVLGLALAANVSLAQRLPGGEWLFLRWSGARAFLAETISADDGLKGGRSMPDAQLTAINRFVGPYSREIAQRTQDIVYGRIAFSSEYNYVLNDPFFIVLLYTPLALVRDFVLARGIWMLLSELALIGSVLLALNLSEWQPPPWLYTTLFGFGLFQYFSLNALVTGSPAIMLIFLYLWILLALRSYADELAGVLLSLVAYQWEVGGLFFVFILFFVLTNRRWRVLAGLVMALFVLLAISFLTNSGWGLPYIRAVLSTWYRAAGLTLSYILTTWFPNIQFPLAPVISLALAIILFIEWAETVHAHFRRVVWTAALSLAATPLIGFPIFPSNHVVLILPFILILALVWERWQRYRVVRILLLLIPVLAIPFALYIRAVSVYDPLVLNLISILPPVAAIVGLYWMRWWAVRSPRIWFDRIGDYA